MRLKGKDLLGKELPINRTSAGNSEVTQTCNLNTQRVKAGSP